MTSTSRFTLMGAVATALAVAAPAGAQDAPPAPDPLGALPPAEEPAPAPETRGARAGRSARRDTGNRPGAHAGARTGLERRTAAGHRRPGPSDAARAPGAAPVAGSAADPRHHLAGRAKRPRGGRPPPPRRRPPTQPPGRPHKRTTACCRSPPQRDWSCSRCSAPPSRCAAPGAGLRKRRSTSRGSKPRPPQPPSPSRCANPPSGAGRSWRRTTARRGRPRPPPAADTATARDSGAVVSRIRAAPASNAFLFGEPLRPLPRARPVPARLSNALPARPAPPFWGPRNQETRRMSTATGPMACPVDGTTLTMSERSGIEIDYCPTCRGVWLDRGELDKIIERNEASQPAAAASRSSPSSRSSAPAAASAVGPAALSAAGPATVRPLRPQAPQAPQELPRGTVRLGAGNRARASRVVPP